MQQHHTEHNDWHKLLPNLSISSVLRYLGALFVAGSGIIYLLQGLVDTNENLRYWAYLAFMAALVVGGLFSHRYMQDNKGARMFFGLAVLMVPVQFTQLGSMLYDRLHLLTNSIAIWQLALLSALSALLAALASFSSLSILMRPYAKKLTLYWLFFNSLLLLPEREFGSMTILALLVMAIYMALSLSLFNRDPRFSLLSGHAVKVSLLAPLMILIVRSGFYISHDLGVSLMILVSALLLHSFHKVLHDFPTLAKAIAITSFVLAIGAWFGVVDEVVPKLAIGRVYQSFIIVLPILAIALRLDQQANGMTIYRLIAAGTLALHALVVFSHDNMLAMLLLAVLAVSLVLYALKNQSLTLLLTSVMILIVSLARIVAISIGEIDVNIWLSSAVFGVLLVAISSVIERYGQSAKMQLIGSLARLQQWRY